MNLTCYIVDDEFHAIEVLETFIKQTPGLELIGSATDPRAALFEVTGSNSPDITFLDVDMPGLSGMEFAGIAAPYTNIIFTTSHPEYAIEAFEKEAFDYLLKPILYERFFRAMVKLKKHFLRRGGHEKPEADHFFIKTETKGKMARINIPEIYFVEASQNYVIIHLDSSKLMAYLTIEEISERLPKDRFVRVHRGFIINTTRIVTIEHGQVTLSNKVVIPLGRIFKDAMLAELSEVLLKSKRSI
jgi:DNA-binding LytR/AlgR family response regulator